MYYILYQSVFQANLVHRFRKSALFWKSCIPHSFLCNFVAFPRMLYSAKVDLMSYRLKKFLACFVPFEIFLKFCYSMLSFGTKLVIFSKSRQNKSSCQTIQEWVNGRARGRLFIKKYCSIKKTSVINEK